LIKCPGGGIGRRTSFRCWRSQGRGGSSPLLGTIHLFNLLLENPWFSAILSGAISAGRRIRSPVFAKNVGPQ
jgi:hypothetical protein